VAKVSISLKTHKLLWGASGNTCAKCKTAVVQDATPTDDPSIVGEEAHIVSKETNGPRYSDPLPMDKRDEFENLMILCNRCHKIVDDQVNTYTVAALRRMKVEHEEWIRNVLGPGGSLAAEHDWKAYQASSISSCAYMVPLRLQPGSDKVHPALEEPFKAELHQWIALAFGHTCIKTPFDNFVYVMSLKRTDEEPRQGFALFELWLLCHITEFVWAFQEWSQFFLDGSKDWKLRSRVKGFTGDQMLNGDSLLGELVPHRIRRLPPTGISILPLVERPKPFDQLVTTSTLLHLMADSLTTKLVVWDDADRCPDLIKVLSMATRINDRRRFSWGDIQLDRGNPESWEYVPQ
jgi:hypothetical protein